MVLYMAVTSDKYELPIAVADSPLELGEMLGRSRNTILSAISHAKRWGSRCCYVRVDLDDGKEKQE